MDGVYEITYEGAPVGKAQIEKQGLYYHFSCRCRLPEEGFFRIHVINSDQRENLGICVPIDDVFGMDKRLPVARLGEGNLSFELLPKEWEFQQVVIERGMEETPDVEEMQLEINEIDNQETGNVIFISVYEDEPFDHLDKLENARMQTCDDLTGVVLTE